MYCKKQQVPYGRAASAKTLTGISILAAVVVVLTVACNFIKFGPFSITLALAPIIIGSALYGKKAGGILGGVFGLVVLLTGLLGMDGRHSALSLLPECFCNDSDLSCQGLGRRISFRPRL